MAMELDIIKADTTWNDAAASLNNNFSKVKLAIAQSEAGGGGIAEESDPIFKASPAAKITDSDIDRWNAGGSGGGPDEDVVIDTEMSDTSTNPVQNKVIKEYVDMHPQYEVIEEVEVPDLPEGSGGSQGSIDLTGYATEQWVTDQDYATEQWVKDQGYITSSSLDDTFTAIDNRLAALEKLLEWFEFDENENMIKAKFGIYSVGAITAGKKKEE